jgi:sigma-B regulation protein RsbU (phosphoserine phosphatase)
MDSTTPSLPEPSELEGDYRPAGSAQLDPVNARVEPADVAYLMRLAEALNTTLDLQTLLNRTSELVRAVIHYRIFAILLLNDRTHELRTGFRSATLPKSSGCAFPSAKASSARWRSPASPSCSTTLPRLSTTSPPIPRYAPNWRYP